MLSLAGWHARLQHKERQRSKEQMYHHRQAADLVVSMLLYLIAARETL